MDQLATIWVICSFFAHGGMICMQDGQTYISREICQSSGNEQRIAEIFSDKMIWKNEWVETKCVTAPFITGSI